MTHFMSHSEKLNILLAQSLKSLQKKMKNQDHQNQNLKPTNINKGLKDCRELNSDNLPNDVDEIFTEINLRKVKSFFFFFQHIIVILNLRTTLLLKLGISLTLSVPHMTDSYWLTILMLKIPKKLCSILLRSITLQTL